MYKIALGAAIFLSTVVSVYAQGAQEEISITTYYPSPMGVYNELSTNRMKIGRNYSAQAVADDNLVVEGRIGIGTINPQAKLDVGGAIKISDGTQGFGKVLTSDNNGMASWQNASVPQGTQCGYRFWGGDYAFTVTCMGHDPSVSCPNGYERHTWRHGGEYATDWQAACFKQ